MDYRISNLIDWTEQDVRETADNLSVSHRSLPEVAIKNFYPSLQAIEEEHGLFAFAPGDSGGLNFLHFQALCPANFLDIHSSYNGIEDFKALHGLSPAELAREIAETRALAMFNGDPAVLGESDIELLSPLLDEEMLGPRRLQLGRVRTRAFNEWMRPEGIEGLEEQANRVFRNHLSGLPESTLIEILKEIRVFGVGTETDAESVLRNVVVGRWISTGCLMPESVEKLEHFISRLDSPIQKAQLLNVVKDAVCSPVTAARGGVFRSTPKQQSQRGYFINQDVGGILFEILDVERADTSSDADALTAGLLSMLAKSPEAKTLPENLDYSLFNFFKEEGCYQILHTALVEAVELAQKRSGQEDIQSVLDRAKSAYNREMSGILRVKKLKDFIMINDTVEPFIEALLGASIAPIEVVAAETAKLVSPGASLAHAVVRSNKKLGNSVG